MPYIAFSNLRKTEINHENVFIKNKADLDILEQKLENNSDVFDEDFIYYNQGNAKQDDFSKNNSPQNFIDQIDNNYARDEIVYDDDLQTISVRQNDIHSQSKDEIEKLEIDELSLSNIDYVEDRIIQDSTEEKKVSTNYKEYETVAPSTEAIAFGGEQQIENTYSSQAKNDELKCPRCGSSLVGAKGICPGCGMQI